MKISKDSDKTTFYLERFGWAKMLSPQTIDKMKLCTFDIGEYLSREGETAEWFFLYVDGKSKVFKLLENGQSMLVRFYLPFQVMGDVELFSEAPYISSVQAISKVQCLGISMDQMKQEAEVNIPFLKHLCKALAWKLTAFNVTSAINQNYPLETRLAGYLSVIYLEGAEHKEEKESLETEDLGEMAELLGCSYRHLTRVLRIFKEEGIIEKSRTKIQILNPSRLKELSQDLYL